MVTMGAWVCACAAAAESVATPRAGFRENRAMTRRAVVVGVLMVTLVMRGASQASAPTRVTVEWLKNLVWTNDHPAGDAFTGSREHLTTIVDAIVADSALVSPMLLFFAAQTAFSLNRLEDAALLFYGAQLRTSFDFSRYDIPNTPDSGDTARYLGFLRKTIGANINSAIMLQPKRFAAVIDRLDRWQVVPSPQAFYPEFANAKGFKTPAATWPSMAATLKGRFMLEFGRKQARLLQDAQYFEAFRFVQAMTLGQMADTPANRARFQKANEEIVAAEKRLFPR